MESLQSCRYRRGVALILTVIVVATLTVLSVGLAYRTRIEIKLAQANARRTKVYYLALAGVERAKALLSQEDPSGERIVHIGHFNNTAKEEKLFDGLAGFGLDDEVSLVYWITDEQGYLNIHESDPASWVNTGSISREYCAGILDWIDADDDVSGGGAETDYYERLRPPYISKNGPCISLKELLFIKGITRGSYVGKALSILSLSEKKFDVEDFQFLPSDGQYPMDLGLVNLLTIHGDGKVNINTASVTVLSALPGLDRQTAETILAYRAGPDGVVATDDDRYIEDLQAIATLEGLTELEAELLQQYCGFNSQYFRIFSYARLKKGWQCLLMATVVTTEKQPQVLSIERLM